MEDGGVVGWERDRLPCILLFTTTCAEMNQITRKWLESTLSVKVREGTINDEKTDTGNAAADTHSRISSSDCSHQSGTAATTAKLAGVQIKEEQANYKLPELEVDLTSTLENESPMKKAKLFDAEEIIMGQELTDNEINQAQQLLKV